MKRMGESIKDRGSHREEEEESQRTQRVSECNVTREDTRNGWMEWYKYGESDIDKSEKEIEF